MEQYYQIFAQALIATCPANYTEARLIAELDQGYSDIRYDCVVEGALQAGLQSKIEDDLKVDKALHGLRQQMTVPGQEPWSKCVFTLHPDGTFKFDVEYDD